MSKQESNRKIQVSFQKSLLLSVIKTDVNLSRLPFFTLSRIGVGHFKTELIIVQARGQEQLELLWRVTSNPEYGYPSPFAKRVHGAVEYLLTQRGFPIPGSLDFSLYEITTILGLENSGNILEKIRGALKSIAATTIESKGTYCYLDNGERRFINKLFHLYDTVIFTGDTLPNGAAADRNRIYFNDWYLKSLNSGYIKPLDFPYWNSLNSDIARRLYEYLSFISFATQCKPFSIEYRKLCEILPVTPQGYLSKAKYCLKAAHQELMATRFLKKVVWRKSKADSKKWVITYSFGPRAESELKRGFQDKTDRPALLAVETADVAAVEEWIESEEKGREAKSACKPKPMKKELSFIAQHLYDRGMTRSVAIALTENFPEAYILEKIAMHDEKKAVGELTTNAAGWLRGAIEEDYQRSQERQGQIRAQAKRKEREADEQALRERAEAICAQRIQEALKNFPTQEEWISQQVEMRKQIRALMVERFGQTPLTEEEISETRRSAMKNYPETEREKLAYLRRNSQAYKADLTDILQELKAESQNTNP